MPVPDRPNLLVILTDQQAATMMSCSGNAYLHTPAMDWIAGSGVRFERAYCTNPVCVPSRFSLMTGRYPSAIGLRHNDARTVDSDSAARHYRQGLGWLLRDAGYDAVYAGKQHLPRARADDAGFRLLTTDERAPLARVCADFVQRPPARPFALVASFINPHDICYYAIRASIGTRWESRESCQLVRHARDEMTCLDESLALPSAVSRETFFRQLCPPLPSNHQPQKDEPGGIEALLKERPFREHARKAFSAEEWRLHRWAYARLTERVDREVGILLDGLRACGRDTDTLVVFTSDHGDHDGAHKLEHKTIPYQEAVRVPFLLRPPGGMGESRVDNDHLVSNGLDLVPTLCDYAGAAVAPDLEGRSLRPWVEGEAVLPWRETIRIESQNSLSIQSGNWQYTRYDSGANREQLYDLRNDPGQGENHARKPENEEILTWHRACWEAEAGEGRMPRRT